MPLPVLAFQHMNESNARFHALANELLIVLHTFLIVSNAAKEEEAEESKLEKACLSTVSISHVT